MKEGSLHDMREHAEEIGFSGLRSADDGDDVLFEIEESRREFPPAMRTGHVGCGNAHGIEGLAAIVEICGEKSEHGVLAKDWVAF